LVDDLQGALEQCIRKHGVAGAAIAIQHGARRFCASAGVLSVETGVAVTPDTLFQIGSVTKVFTATLILQLADQGKLSIDDPVTRYLPQLRLQGAAAPASLLIRHLLNHTSGLDGDFFLDTGRNPDALERYVMACDQLPFLSAPGRHYSYCNAGYSILGRIIETLTSLSWDDALRKRLLEPIGASTSATLAEEAVKMRAAVGHHYDVRSQTLRVVDRITLPRSLGPAGFTLAMTADGLADFMLMHFTGGRKNGGQCVLTEDSAVSMRDTTVRLPDGTGWGLGWKVLQRDNRALVGHDGGAAGQGAFLWGIPDRQLIVAVVHNGGNSAFLHRELVQRALEEMGDWPPEAAPDLSQIDESRDLERYSGVYENIGMRLTIRARAGRLHVLGEHLQMPAPPPDFEVVPLTGGRFFARIAPGMEPVEMAFLEPDANGRPRYFHAGRLHRRVSAA
jgi:CubicO group peptidase (beta-lactamase class C family)